jgi:mRNA-degrading endonuclease RelE of RelBE toxin-antitoxin system
MKILATNKFNSAMKSFANDNLQNKLLSLIEDAQKSDDVNSLTKQSLPLRDDVYVLKIDSYRLFFSIVNGNILFVDILMHDIGLREPLKTGSSDKCVIHKAYS